MMTDHKIDGRDVMARKATPKSDGGGGSMGMMGGAPNCMGGTMGGSGGMLPVPTLTGGGVGSYGGGRG
eukprot:CAMPEP_0119083550 /NCGR_PEP_ID=MMETSP1178-20130426/125976_1 /TAXON_ID=33656 /ORGANISM="unid sp, Strain CCMP2000" /LENGTH=67 /DNA_ID=CAMNT_0007066425 /DNA_START=1 /DNA_END=200 /DNA_ORIENTATION=-